MVDTSNRRGDSEIAHGRWLNEHDPELTWGWGSPAGRVRARRRAELIAAGAELGPNVRALEVGCGTGLFTESFAETGATIIAVDISPELLARARERKLPPERVQFLEMRFEESKLAGPFDAVMGSSVLHHLALKTALQNIFDLLKPGGRMSFAEPNMLNPQIFLERKLRFLFPAVSPGETAFRRQALKRALQETGFTKVEIKPFDWLHPAVPEGLISIALSIGAILEKTPVLREFAGSLHILAQRPTPPGHPAGRHRHGQDRPHARRDRPCRQGPHHPRGGPARRATLGCPATGGDHRQAHRRRGDLLP